ncbi:MAG TPA: hypothetical protein VIY52_32945 [Streptosporangiaceae bacterium]
MRFAAGGGLVAAARELTRLVPERDQAPQDAWAVRRSEIRRSWVLSLGSLRLEYVIARSSLRELVIMLMVVMVRVGAGLIPITVPELLRLLRDTVIPPPRRDRAHRLHWSAWRRRHQHRARQAHQSWNAYAETAP